jgi:hypothetical protein
MVLIGLVCQFLIREGWRVKAVQNFEQIPGTECEADPADILQVATGNVFVVRNGPNPHARNLHRRTSGAGWQCQRGFKSSRRC